MREIRKVDFIELSKLALQAEKVSKQLST